MRIVVFGVVQVAEVDAANLELEDANTRLEAGAAAAAAEKALLLQQSQEVQQAADKLAMDLQAKEDELEQLIKANYSLKVNDAYHFSDPVTFALAVPYD